jgi:hypothetical protein
VLTDADANTILYSPARKTTGNSGIYLLWGLPAAKLDATGQTWNRLSIPPFVFGYLPELSGKPSRFDKRRVNRTEHCLYCCGTCFTLIFSSILLPFFSALGVWFDRLNCALRPAIQ